MSQSVLSCLGWGPNMFEHTTTQELSTRCLHFISHLDTVTVWRKLGTENSALAEKRSLFYVPARSSIRVIMTCWLGSCPSLGRIHC